MDDGERTLVSNEPSPKPAHHLQSQSGASFAELVSIMRRLLAPDGCPWDREQDERSLRQYVLEEAAEVVDAIDVGDDDDLCEELGDLSLQVAFLSELARARGAFGPDDVFASICEKMVRRHPHVFGQTEVKDAADVVVNWEAIKRLEKPSKRRGVLGNVPRNLSALTRASLYSSRAARVGFDWPEAAGARAKVDEELAELERAVDARSEAEVREEFGDLLFALVNWARHLGVDPEASLREAADKFERRFAHVEQRVDEQGGWPKDASGKPTRGIHLEQLDAYWEEAKSRREHQ
jgi:tetrapyrrole methylase family protein/MazG family protein/ATP diphosphatase